MDFRQIFQQRDNEQPVALRLHLLLTKNRIYYDLVAFARRSNPHTQHNLLELENKWRAGNNRRPDRACRSRARPDAS